MAWLRSILILSCLACAGPVVADEFASLQEKLFAALKKNATISRDTQLVSAVYICTLVVKGENLGVFDVVEYVRGAQVPRANNRIVVLDGAMKPVKILPYADQAPMFCRGDRLYVHGDLGIDNTEPYGNTLTFSARDDVSVSSTNPNELPIPPTSQRPTYLLK